MLDTAWAHGVRYFDCANSYGQSERFLAAWLRDCDGKGLDMTSLVVGSKWGYKYTADWRVEVPTGAKDRIPVDFMSSISLKCNRTLSQEKCMR